LILSALTGGLCIAPALSQNKTPGPVAPKPQVAAPAPAGRAIVTHFTPSIVGKALTDTGVTDTSVRQEKAKDGRNVDIVSFSVGGTKHVAILSVCTDGKGCLAVEFLTVWADAGKTASRTALNTYNATYGFGKGFAGPSGTLVYQRYAISDGGVTMDNVRANIGNFVTGSQNFEAFMSKQAAGTSASVAPVDTTPHLAVSALSPQSAAVVLSLGKSQGLNVLKAPAPSKPAQ
jgi:hypothetical protein